MIDHYEIQRRQPGREWKHVGSIYPEYNWEVYKPWYFFGTIRRARITNRKMALMHAARDLIRMLVNTRYTHNEEHVRTVFWRRGLFGRLHKVKILDA